MLSGNIALIKKSKLLFYFLATLSLFLFSSSPSVARASTADNWIPQASLPIVTGPDNQDIPKIDGDVLVWREWVNGSPLLFGKNLSTGVGGELDNISLSRYLQNIDI